jgi:hypothetical protein
VVIKKKVTSNNKPAKVERHAGAIPTISSPSILHFFLKEKYLTILFTHVNDHGQDEDILVASALSLEGIQNNRICRLLSSICPLAIFPVPQNTENLA